MWGCEIAELLVPDYLRAILMVVHQGDNSFKIINKILVIYCTVYMLVKYLIIDLIILKYCYLLGGFKFGYDLHSQIMIIVII
jgi:hypothetical protein